MQQNNSSQILPPERIKDNYEVIDKADQCSLLMAVVCEKLGLDPKRTTMEHLINTFTALQVDKMKRQEELRSQFPLMDAQVPKRRKRQPKDKDGMSINERIAENEKQVYDDVLTYVEESADPDL